jgi:hypothetical protein
MALALGCGLALVIAVGAGTARGEHNSALPKGPAPEPALDLDMRFERNGFRLGGRVLGPGSVWGAWLNGRGRPGGFTLDGRLQGDEHAYNFRFDTGGDDGQAGAQLRWWRRDLSAPSAR